MAPGPRSGALSNSTILVYNRCYVEIKSRTQHLLLKALLSKWITVCMQQKPTEYNQDRIF